MSSSPLPPSLPPFVKYVLVPTCTVLLWWTLGSVGMLLMGAACFGWYVYEGYADVPTS